MTITSKLQSSDTLPHAGSVYGAIDRMAPNDYERRVCGNNAFALMLVRAGWVALRPDGNPGMPEASAHFVNLLGPVVAGRPGWGLMLGAFARSGQVVHGIRAVVDKDVLKSAHTALGNALNAIAREAMSGSGVAEYREQALRTGRPGSGLVTMGDEAGAGVGRGGGQ